MQITKLPEMLTESPKISSDVELDGLTLDVRQRDAYGQWLELPRAPSGVPLRSAFRPERSRLALPTSVYLEVDRGGHQLSFNNLIEGRIASAVFGEAGRAPIEEVFTDEHLFRVMPRYLETSVTGEASMTELEEPRPYREPFRFNRLILPFAEESGLVSRLLVVFGFKDTELATLREPLHIRQVPAYRQRAGSPIRVEQERRRA